MYEEQETCSLTCGGEEVAMKSVHVHGKLDGLLLKMKTRQTYTNQTEDTLETVYTFPLAWGATLLNLAVELNGKRLNGTVIEKKQAVKKYEKAIDNGDSPIMVERSGRGLYTANLGNLLPGETAIIEIEYAQLLNFEADRIRLSIPTTIAPRYGDQHQQGGLQPHQTAAANGLVEYGFFMTLDIQGTAAKGMVSSPTHAIKTTKSSDGINVQLGKQAYLDRDFVLLIEDLEGESFCIAGPDTEGSNTTAIITSFCPKLPPSKPNALRLKILLDCSGSMAGDSMVQGRLALQHLFKSFKANDCFAYTRFGSSVQRETPRMVMADSERIEGLLQKLPKTEADLGGTELGMAMTDVFNMNTNGRARNNPEVTDSADVLLITDGEVWNIENIIALARTSGHRVYTIGVGSAPAESLLRELAKDTGGTCEFDLPAYFDWQHHSVEQRRADLLRWTACLEPLAASISLLIKMLRDSGSAQKVVAPGGQFQQNLPQGRTFQLLRLRIDAAAGLIPEISGNRMLFTVRMMRQIDGDRLQATNEDAAFELTLCA